MTEEVITVESGVSWLHDKMKQELEDRKLLLQEGIAAGVPNDEYRQMVGRYRECKRHIGVLADIFTDFYRSEDGVDADGLEEIDDE